MKQRWQKMSGENQEKTRDRFELEQEILECWKVTNDITMFIDQGASVEDFKTLADYYEKKFDRLWSTFELLTQQGNIK